MIYLTRTTVPISGEIKGIGGFIMAAGHEGDDIALSPITGQLITGLIIKGKTSISIDAFKLSRFYQK